MRKQISWLIAEGSLHIVYHNNAHIFSLNLGEAKRRFDNLKKRFSKKKQRAKKQQDPGQEVVRRNRQRRNSKNMISSVGLHRT